MRTETTHYLIAALWADLRDDEGEPLDEYSILDIDGASIETAESDVAAFLAMADSKLPASWRDHWDAEQIGHDFWLTRNGHGAGFWDRGRPFGDELTRIAESFGTADIYLGDDGVVYLA